jgi:16S rRNA (guanine527-N7)-methyltransferase
VTSGEFRGRLNARADAAGLTISTELAQRLEAYYRLLFTWNQKINLTALDLAALPDEAADRLFIEPLVAAQFAPRGGRVLDVGSGGGSPAIPFALASEANALTMVESKSRKSVFLREAARAAVLAQTEVVTARFEQVADSPRFQATFDVVTIRAVRIATDDWARLRTVLRTGGSLLFLHQAGLYTADTAEFGPRVAHRLTTNAEVSVFLRLA